MPDVGMAGGGKLESYLRRIAERVAEPEEVRVGFLEGATYPDGTSVALVAYESEYGHPAFGQPPRPFFRGMIVAHKDEWGDQLGKVLAAREYDSSAALASMGQVIAGELREAIVGFAGASLAPATVAAKGSTKALVDTGYMLSRVDYEVGEP